METEKIEHLLKKYFEGETTLEEEQQLRSFFSGEEIPDHLKSYADLFRYQDHVGAGSTDIDPFGKIPNTGMATDELPAGSSSPHVFQWSLRIAAGLILLLIGFSAGMMLSRQDETTDIELAALQEEVQQMKNALMYSTYSHTSASAGERISAVNMGARLSASKRLDAEITEILIYTMNNDRNVNVRLAAAEALFNFREEPRVGKALTNALARQDDPMMQITLIDMLVKIKEKQAINEMQKLLMDSETQEAVRQRLQEGIAELKA